MQMFRFFSVLAMALVCGILVGADTSHARDLVNIDQIRQSVVRIYVVSQVPDYQTPWGPGRASSGWGTGFVISGQRILTNAHVSSNARFISVEKDGDARRYEARVQFIAHDCDLAVLAVSDPAFFEGTRPLALGGVPELDSTVVAVGYPIGGDRLSVTRGVVSRIDYRVYSHSGVDSHLAIQIDAAINPGNSGGPVIQDNAVVGVAFQGFSGMVAQNVGYMIPMPVVQRFLTDIQDGRYDRYVDLGIEYFPLINATHRQALGLGPGDAGVTVSNVLKVSTAHGRIQNQDVLMAIDGLPIFSDGHVLLDGDRVLLNEVVERKYSGDTVRIDILRNGKPMSVTIPLSFPWPYLTRARGHDRQSRFVVFSGMVFQPLNQDLINTIDGAGVNLRYHFQMFMADDIFMKRPEVVVLSKLLPDPINTHFKGFMRQIVDQINDTRIRTLEDVATAFKKSARFYVIRFLGAHPPLVIDGADALTAHQRIVERYGITRESFLGDSIIPEGWQPTDPSTGDSQ